MKNIEEKTDWKRKFAVNYWGDRSATILGVGITTLFGLIYFPLTDPDFSFKDPRKQLHRNGFHYDIVEKQYPGVSAVRYNSTSLNDYLILNNKK